MNVPNRAENPTADVQGGAELLSSVCGNLIMIRA